MYKLHDPALHYAVDLIDAFVVQEPGLPRKRLQLLGVCAMLVADKVLGNGDITPADMAYICDNAYTVAEVREMEPELVPFFNGVWCGWGAFHFTAHFAAELDFPQQWFHLAHMFLESGLLCFA